MYVGLLYSPGWKKTDTVCEQRACVGMAWPLLDMERNRVRSRQHEAGREQGMETRRHLIQQVCILNIQNPFQIVLGMTVFVYDTQ
jgi:hypothetical protein